MQVGGDKDGTMYRGKFYKLNDSGKNAGTFEPKKAGELVVEADQTYTINFTLYPELQISEYYSQENPGSPYGTLKGQISFDSEEEEETEGAGSRTIAKMGPYQLSSDFGNKDVSVLIGELVASGDMPAGIWPAPYIFILRDILQISQSKWQNLSKEAVFGADFKDPMIFGATDAQVLEIVAAFQAYSEIDIPAEHESKVNSIVMFILGAMQVELSNSVVGQDVGLTLESFGQPTFSGGTDFGFEDTFESLGLYFEEMDDATRAVTEPFVPGFVDLIGFRFM